MKITLSKKQWELIGKKAGWSPYGKGGDLESGFEEIVKHDNDKKGKKQCVRCKKKPAMPSYSTCFECHEDSLSEAEHDLNVQ